MHVFSTNQAYLSELGTGGTGFAIARSDWEYVLNTFVFEMAVGRVNPCAQEPPAFVRPPYSSCLSSQLPLLRIGSRDN